MDENALNVCRKIRKYAALGLITIDHRKHKGNNGLNIHLFQAIEACGISCDKFICGYLSVLQPYALEPF